MKYLNVLLKITFFSGLFCFIMIFISMIPYGFGEHYWDSPFDAPPFMWMFAGFILVIGSLIAQMLVRSIQESKKKNYLLAYGIRTIADVTNVKPTGSSINDQPEIEVDVQFETIDRKQVVASFKKVVLITQLHYLQPGMKLFIKYDAKNPKRIIIDPQSEKDVNPFQKWDSKTMDQFVEETFHTIREGVYTQAVIVSIIPTGKIVAGNAEMEVKLKVTRPNNSIFDATIFKVLPSFALSKLTVGSVIQVQYSKTNEQDIAIVLSL